MIALIQRVNFAHVKVDNQIIAQIDKGLLAFIGVEKEDTQENVVNLFNKIRKFRLFPDKHEKSNLSVEDIDGSILLVPQFTLPANTQKGNRPGFNNVGSPELGKKHFDEIVFLFKTQTKLNIAQGIFQSHMKIVLENDGPMTFWLKK